MCGQDVVRHAIGWVYDTAGADVVTGLRKEVPWMSEEVNKDCKCPSVNCKRHGKCKECREYHVKQGGKTWCGRGA